ncbi:MAG TPA: trypsin-like peptidase domain-containing protein [Rectinemataceae bacterium]|nr:trypsin-like peptidase domain-containing protein [Rectinemataceae bacterium]
MNRATRSKAAARLRPAALAALAAFALMACASSPKPSIKDATPYSDLKLQQLKDLAQADPARAVEAGVELMAATPGPGQGPSTSDVRSVAASAIGRLETAYRTALDGQDWRSARSLWLSLRAICGDGRLSDLVSGDPILGAIAKEETREPEFLAKDAEAFYAKGLVTAALIQYHAALDAGRSRSKDFAAEELKRWTDRALAARDRVSLARFSQAFKALGQSLPQAAIDLLAAKDQLSSMRKGVVTLNIDKGIRIEQGMGLPDRVLGSGFYIDAGGYLITNYHVIESEVDPTYKGYSKLTVRPADSPELRLPAKVVGWDRLLDIALVKVTATPEYVFSLGDGTDLTPGQRIYAIGSPAGLENTITSGIVSAVGRRILQTGETVQVDAALNPGNSGGPLVNEDGIASGVVFAGLPQFQNLNFAIPASWVSRIVPELFRGGELKRAWLGLALAEAQDPSTEVKPGIEVLYRHPQMNSGIERGDRVISVDGAAFSRVPPAQGVMLGLSPGGLALVEVAKEGSTRKLLRYLGERPFIPLEAAAASDRHDRVFPALFGMAVSQIPGNLLEPEAYMISKVWPGTVADEAGLSENDPFVLRRFMIDSDQHAAIIQIDVKKRKAGFLESIIQIPAPLDIPDFI